MRAIAHGGLLGDDWLTGMDPSFLRYNSHPAPEKFHGTAN
jgi:hypothetical protein